MLRMAGADSLSVPCHSEGRSDEESCSEYGRCKGRRSFASLRMTGKGTLRMTGVEVLRMTGADSLSVPCHSEERSDEESCSEYGRCKGRRSFASLRMTGKGTLRMTEVEVFRMTGMEMLWTTRGKRSG